jgi:hypothetical protein
MHEEDNPLFLDEFIKFTCFLAVLFIFIFLVLGYWVVETLGD